MKCFFTLSFLVLLFASCSSKNSSKKATKEVKIEKTDKEFNIEFDKKTNLSKQSINLLYELCYSKKLTGNISSLNRSFRKENFLWVLIEFTEEGQFAEIRNLFVFEKKNGSQYQLVHSQEIQLPMGECSISLGQQLVDLGDLIIVNETGDGNGYCAYFPSFYKLKGNKLHLQNTLELVTYSFPEGQDYFTESSFSFSKIKNQVFIKTVSRNKFPDQEKKFKQTNTTQTFQVKGDSLISVN